MRICHDGWCLRGGWRGSGLSGLLKGLDGDLVAEGLELFDGAGFRFGGVAAGVVVGAGIAVELTVLQHVPGGGDHRVLDCDDSFHRAAAAGQTPVFRRQVAVLGSGRCQRGNAENAFEVTVTGSGFAGFDPAGGFVGAGADPVQDAR